MIRIVIRYIGLLGGSYAIQRKKGAWVLETFTPSI
jgi:hypothetical protein